jgi:signal transduction histidine kinase
VWINYLTNAFKYGEPLAVVAIGGAPVERGQVKYWVRSRGRALTEDEQKQLFTPFARLHEDRGPGHGLGLTITRRIVEKLGGTTGVAALPDGGNEFFFTLPTVRPRR